MARPGFDLVRPNLWMGSAPPCDAKFGMRFDTLVLTAVEYQPPKKCFPVHEVLRAPLDDSGARMSAKEIVWAIRAAEQVAQRVEANKRVLVTCWQGRNRSGLVTALALRKLGATPEQAIQAVRRARGASALVNPQFVRLVQAY